MPRKSAPKLMTNRAFARSNVGICARPKLSSLARRTTSSSNSSHAMGGGAPNLRQELLHHQPAVAAARPAEERQRALVCRADASMSSRPTSSAIASSHDTAWYFASPRLPDRFSGCVMRSGW